MSYFKRDGVLGLMVGNQLVCLDCALDAELDEATKDELLTADKLRRKRGFWVFCDRCGAIVYEKRP